MFEKVRAVEARRPFGPIWRFRAVLENTPGVQSPYKAAITKNGWFNFWALDPKPWDFRSVPCCDYRGGRGGKINEHPAPGGVRCSLAFRPRPPLESQQGTGPKSKGFGSSAQKLNHPFFVIAAIYTDWTPRGVFQDGLKTPNRLKWPSRLDGAHLFKHMCFCSFL